jgi:hypothetical protein
VSNHCTAIEAPLIFGLAEHDPPGYRRRRWEEKQEKKLKRRSSLPAHPFSSDKPKRRSTWSSRRSARSEDERPLSKNESQANNAQRSSFAPVTLQDNNSRSATPNKLYKAQSIRSNRTADAARRETVPVTTTYPNQPVAAGQFGNGYPTQDGVIVEQQKIGQDVTYIGGTPAVREGEIDLRNSVSTAGVADEEPLKWREQPVVQHQQPVQQSSRPSTRPTSMMEQPKYSYSGQPTAPGVQRYPMQRGETGYE